MKPIRTYLLSILLSLAASAASTWATTHYYVETAGIDRATGGSQSAPWQTLAYAAARVTTADSVIHVGVGTFSESATVALRQGVSLDGAGESSTILTTATTVSGTATGQAGKLLQIVTWGTTSVDGNQAVSNLTIDGKNQTVMFGLFINGRNNVTVHDVTIKNCYREALYAQGPGASPAPTWPALPDNSVLLSNLQIYNCTFLNSGYIPDGVNWGYGAVGLYWLRDSSLHHCLIDNTSFGGFNIKADWGRQVTINNCRLVVAAQWPNTARGKGFGIEFQHLDGADIFDNKTNGAISLSISNSRIHHNVIASPAGEGVTEGFEFDARDSQLFANYIERMAPAIAVWGGAASNVLIHNNVIRACQSGIFISAETGSVHDTIKIYNNTIDACSELWYLTSIGARVMDAAATVNNLQIYNNIISNSTANGSDRGAIILAGYNGHSTSYAANITNTVIKNNLYYNNQYADLKDWGATGTVTASNVTGNPCYLGGTVYPSPYYILAANSPALGTGLNVGLPYLMSAPNRGAFVRDDAFVSGASARIEAEMNHSLVTDTGSYGAICATDLLLDSCKSIGFFDNGDTLRIHFSVPADGTYQIWVRVRSGDSTSNVSYWPSANNKYAFKLDSFTAITLTGDLSTISTYDMRGGGVYWGTMKSDYLYLTQGQHSLEVKDAGSWAYVDYMEVKAQ